jgi:hypothetical protein
VFAARYGTTMKSIAIMLGVLGVALAAGCAGTGGAPGMAGPGGGAREPGPVPEGKGRIWLKTGGIAELNFYVLDQRTGEEVYSETPRLPASSPAAYESGVSRPPLHVDLPPGTYSLVVTTDIKDNVQFRNLKIGMGQERSLRIPVGRFQLICADDKGPTQMPFLIYDFNLRTVLGKGMTSTELRYFIAPVGRYKVRIENAPTGRDEIRSVGIAFGQTRHIRIGPAPAKPKPTPGSSQSQP